ncbi:UDP-2,4-diacetamido-2,4,6-trideoxy-beta-L-altropyranose hydrolase [Corallincola luteus]|uniref:UDP-2,4-diacetamido-2,4, 6-trideoxy-beta-L-altropyranose hydrolase n=1 Tax=Corallincola luteus TaxID=1775177 RepID=A0ABY2AQ98_9GAMM|nr:UDP-2,4-diacetamido-2,4,6-trideoxy-beta-L-altropyranose hydrolase [Corallincola luteus]TCI05369.1 UDP-2,4-diacetamido-2,4,6-trideoxy-beta-L-altropyranose hydrolase [Corallincola luteus]
MRIVFRTDASTEIGNGHLARCLTLAHQLQSKGCEILFICRELPGHRAALIKKQGFQLELLKTDRSDESKQTQVTTECLPAHSPWLGCLWQQDAQQTLTRLSNQPCDWLVVDHYALDKQWQAHVKTGYHKLLVIDDLADREHLADILVDASPGRQAAHYKALVPEHCTLLCGPNFALLRGEFSGFKRPAYQSNNPIKLLIAMGGVDKDNVSAWLLKEINQMQPPPNIASIEVLLSESAIHLARVKSQTELMTIKTELVVEPSSIAERLAHADLCIGAPGGSALERCAMALPSLLITTAENQRHNAMELTKAKAALSLGCFKTLNPQQFKEQLLTISTAPDTLNQLAGCAVQLCDGHGVKRVLQALFQAECQVRAATAMDKDLLYRWQTAPGVRDYSRTPEPPSYQTHCQWFEKVLADNERSLLILELSDDAVGMLRFDRQQEGWEISILIAPEHQGKGLARTALDWAKQSQFTPIFAEVHPDNLVSQQLFSRAGFKRLSENQFKYTQTQQDPR